MFCIHCGKEIEDDSKFCGYCGKSLVEEAEVAPAEPVEEASAETAPVSAVEETKETAEPVEEKPAETVPESAVEEAKENVEKAVEAVNETVENAAEALREAAGETAEAPAEAAVTPEEKTESLSAPEELPVAKEGGAKALDVRALVKNKTVLIIAAALAALVLLVVIAVVSSVSASSGGTGIKGDYYGDFVDKEFVMYYNGTKVKLPSLSDNGEPAYGVYSADGTKHAAICDDGLYYFDNGKITEIFDEEVSKYEISADGSTVVYMCDDNIYTFKKGKSTKVATVDEKFYSMVISPNGDTVVYAETDKNGRYSTYAVKNGKMIDLDARILPLSVSNGGEVLYGIDKNEKLCYIKGLKKDSAESVKELSRYIYCTNSDNKQIIFVSGNGCYYFDTTLEEPIKITSNYIDLIYPAGSIETYSDFKSFFSFSSDGRIYKYTRKGKDDFETERLAILANYHGILYQLSSDGKTLVYMNKDNDLCRISVANPDKVEVLAENIEGFVADDSLNHIYFGNSDSDIRYYDGKSKNGKKILSEADTGIDGDLTPNGVLVYADEDGDLYYSDRGGDKKKAGVDDVESITVAKDGTVYVKADGEIYVSADGKKFTKS